MDTSERIKLILVGLGYTPKTLSEATGISVYRAKKIFTDGEKIRCRELFDICVLTGMSPNHFMGTPMVQRQAVSR